MSKAKNEHEVYFHTDTHWNDNGALDTFNLIIKKLNRWFPELKRIDSNSIDREPEKFSGDLTNMLHQVDDISEISEFVSFKSPCSKKRKDKQIPLSLSKMIKSRDLESRPFPVENGCNIEKLTVLLIHDSFGIYLRPYFNERFYRVIYSSKYEFSELHDLIVRLNPDVVIEERVARDINRTLSQDIQLEAEVVAYHMSKSEKKVVLDITTDKIDDQIQFEYNAVIIKDKDDYLINAVTSDPQLFFQFKPLGRNIRYNAMVELTVPGDTQLQLFYMPEGATSYNSRFSVRRKLKKGYNQLYFHIPGPVIKGEIRLDPGGVAGLYILHALVIKER